MHYNKHSLPSHLEDFWAWNMEWWVAVEVELPQLLGAEINLMMIMLLLLVKHVPKTVSVLVFFWNAIHPCFVCSYYHAYAFLLFYWHLMCGCCHSRSFLFSLQWGNCPISSSPMPAGCTQWCEQGNWKHIQRLRKNFIHLWIIFRSSQIHKLNKTNERRSIG